MVVHVDHGIMKGSTGNEKKKMFLILLTTMRTYTKMITRLSRKDLLLNARMSALLITTKPLISCFNVLFKV